MCSYFSPNDEVCAVMKMLKHAKNTGFVEKYIVFYKMMARRLRGIAEMV